MEAKSQACNTHTKKKRKNPHCEQNSYMSIGMPGVHESGYEKTIQPNPRGSSWTYGLDSFFKITIIIIIIKLSIRTTSSQIKENLKPNNLKHNIKLTQTI